MPGEREVANVPIGADMPMGYIFRCVMVAGVVLAQVAGCERESRSRNGVPAPGEAGRRGDCARERRGSVPAGGGEGQA